jgi:hypothetical protein
MLKLSDSFRAEGNRVCGHNTQFLMYEVLTKRILKKRCVDWSLDGHEQRCHCLVHLDRQPCMARQAQPHCQGNLHTLQCSSQLGRMSLQAQLKTLTLKHLKTV